jgi:SAM-dependent methyltransferase
MTRRRTPSSGPDSWKGVAAHLRDAARLRAELPGEAAAIERALLELAGRVHGKRALVQGGDSAALERALAEQGAEVERALDPLETAMPRGPFDLVLALGLDESKEPERALRALGRVLHPRGRLVLALVHPWHGVGQRAFRALPDLLAALREAGVRAVAALEPEPEPAPNAAQPPARHLILLAERTGRRGPNRGTSG